MTTAKTLGQIAIKAADDFEDKNDGLDLLKLTEGAWEAAAQAVRNAVIEECAEIADRRAAEARRLFRYEAAGDLDGRERS